MPLGGVRRDHGQRQQRTESWALVSFLEAANGFLTLAT